MTYTVPIDGTKKVLKQSQPAESRLLGRVSQQSVDESQQPMEKPPQPARESRQPMREPQQLAVGRYQSTGGSQKLMGEPRHLAEKTEGTRKSLWSTVEMGESQLPVVIEEARAKDTVIALMGPTGVGKSSFIANATKQEGKGVGHDLISCTSEIKATKCHVEGFSIVLVDTPGIDDTNKSDMHILKLISDWIPLDNRMAGTPLKNLRFFERLCGKNAMSKVTLVTTMWDEAGSEVGKERLTELKQGHWKGMISQGSTTFECVDAHAPMRLLRQIVQRVKEQDLSRGDEDNVLLQETMSWLCWKKWLSSSCVVV